MDKNTVILDLDEYNNLKYDRVAFEKMKSKNYICFDYNNGVDIYSIKKSKVIEILSVNLKNLAKELKVTEQKLYLSKHNDNVMLNGKSLNDIKKMNIFQFIKWRKNKNQYDKSRNK